MQRRQMQDFGNRLQQAGGWLQNINPGIPAAPSIHRRRTAATSAAQATPADELLLIPD
jgi:hypothetical protein